MSVAKTEIFVNRVSPVSHMNTSNFLRRKEWRGKISETELAWLTAGSYEAALKDALICRHLLGCMPTDPPESFRFSLPEKYQFGSPVFYISGNNVEFSEEKSPEECCKIWQFRASKRLNNLR